MSCFRSLGTELWRHDNGYDERIVIRVAKSYVSFCFEQIHCKNIFHWKIDRCFSYPSCKGWEPWCKKFSVTCRSIPKDARYCDDNLNRAMDMYPKVQKFFSFLVMITLLENWIPKTYNHKAQCWLLLDILKLNGC